MQTINPNTYTSKKRRWLKTNGRVCVYSAAPKPEGPTRIGCTTDLVYRMNTLQPGNWLKLGFYSAMWCVGEPVAFRLEEVIHQRLHGKRILGEWFDIDAKSATEIVKTTARELYPSIEFLDHQAMLDRLRQLPLDRKDHAA